MVRSPKNNPIAVRFSDEDRAALEALSEEEDVSIGHVVRRAVREYLDRQPKKPKPKSK